jgi:plasmid stabilization system protein ParE
MYRVKALPSAAELRKKISILKSEPCLYAEYEDDPYYRKVAVGEYAMFYHIDESTKIVEIHRILRASGDLPRRLSGG